MPNTTTPEARRARNISSAEWDRENTKQIKCKLNLHTDADIIRHLKAKSNVQGYLKKLIRDDITREKGGNIQ